MITLPRLSLHRTCTPSPITLLGLVSMLLLLATAPAHAADLFSPVPGDMSMKRKRSIRHTLTVGPKLFAQSFKAMEARQFAVWRS